MEKVPTIGDLLFEYWKKYEMEIREDVSQKEFAKHIGIGDKLYNHIFTGRRKPSKEVLTQLANFFNDPRFYDAAGEQRPDEELFYIQSTWTRLPKKIRDSMVETARKYVDEKIEKKKNRQILFND